MKHSISGLLSVFSIITYHALGEVIMTQSPSSIVLPEADETVINCRMNIAPDRFQWRHYPVNHTLAHSSTYHLVLADAAFKDLPSHLYKSDNYSTSLTIKNTNISVAGDYQCLAHYGAEVFASKPGRVSIPILKEIPAEESVSADVLQGNAVLWRCGDPESNPTAFMEYYKGDKMIYPKYSGMSSLILENVKPADSGDYSCKAYNTFSRVTSAIRLHLRVTHHLSRSAPRFLVPPKSKYTILEGTPAFLECAAVGAPVPKVTWTKHNGVLSNTTIQEAGGLNIPHMTPGDAGTYTCHHNNSEGSLPFHIVVEYHEKPVVRGPFKKDVKKNVQEGQDLDVECDVIGHPKPAITWFLNGDTITDDRHIKIVHNMLHFRPVHKRHAGMIQCFASNIVGTDSGMTTIEVFPKQISGFEVTEYTSTARSRQKTKHRKKRPMFTNMNPPSKPNVTRMNDESVVVRWNISTENGLKIKFCKVQYRDVAQGRWMTANPDILPHITSFQINALQSDHSYKFRIAAVYSNDDNLLSPNSDTFHLSRSDFYMRNPLPTPIITMTETVNATTIQVFWEYTSNPNISISGFYVNYMPTNSAGDYTKDTVDGENVRMYSITHLDPGTLYDFKMQSFSSKSASDFSPIMTERTASITVETTTVQPIKKQEEKGSNVYVMVAVSVAALVCLLTIATLLVLCCRWKMKKKQSADGGVKQVGEDLNHHIEAHKSSRTNGFVTSGNHITIRSNPLADADNKNQNMIEMSCLTAQNNNCSGQASTTTNSQDNHHNNAIKNKRHKAKDISPGENYV